MSSSNIQVLSLKKLRLNQLFRSEDSDQAENVMIFNMKEEKDAGASGEDYDEAAAEDISSATGAVISGELN